MCVYFLTSYVPRIFDMIRQFIPKRNNSIIKKKKKKERKEKKKKKKEKRIQLVCSPNFRNLS